MILLRLVLPVAGLLYALGPAAHAASAADLYALPVPESCMTQIGIMGLLVTSRDQGMSSEEAQARFHHMRPDLEIPRELAANVFDFPELGMRPLERYTLWSCHAQAHMIRTLPLKEVAADMRDCYANARPQECAIIFQNRITGLPADYRPKSSMAPVPARP